MTWPGAAGGPRPGAGSKVTRMASKPKQLLAELSHPGPHEVLRGNLALVGLPGIVFTPRSGLGNMMVEFADSAPGRGVIVRVR